MDEDNISFVNKNNKFNFRVALLIRYKNKVLLENNNLFWNMIGGRVHFGESSLIAIKREINEELGIQIDDLKLINISENFFSWMGKKQQELLFIYEAYLDNSFDCTKKDEIKCKDCNVNFKWFDINEIESLDCRPDIIKQLVKSNSDCISHKIKYEN